MSKYQVIALIGKSGAGKDTVQKYMTRHYDFLNPIISCTTRPARNGEQDGKDYHFLSLEQFGEKVLNGEMLEATEFRNWFYGTPISSLRQDKINIGVFNPAGVNALLEDSRLDVYVVYVICNDKDRLTRCLARETTPDCLEICRRFLTDESDFKYLDFDEYIEFNNYEFRTPDIFEEGAFPQEALHSMLAVLKDDKGKIISK